MTAKRIDTITATARAYRQSGRPRARIIDGPAAGLNVRCPWVWRRDWQDGDTIVLRGVLVDGNGAAYFKAQNIEE